MRSRLRSSFALITLALGCALGVGEQAAPAQAGDPINIYVSSESLAEAERPGVELAAGASFWLPGPERFYGWALRDLNRCIGAMAGDTRLAAAGEAPGPGIVAGTLGDFPDFASQQADWPWLADCDDPEAFVIEAQGETLYVLGRSRAGLIAAIYTLLDTLGCKWYAPGDAWETIAALQAPLVDPRWNRVSAGPSYSARFFFASFGVNTDIEDPQRRARDYTLWNLRNRMGGSAYAAAHHNDPEMVPPELFETRPELFALVDGRRTSYALSRANPDTVTMAIDRAVEYLKKHEGQGSYYDSFSVETNDGSSACQWSLERMARDRLGEATATDLNYWFANQVAEGIERAGLTDKWVGMCSYSDHAGVPSFDLHPRVAVMVTTALDTSSGLSVQQRLDGLRRRGCRRLGIYHYLNLVTWSLDKPGAHPAADPRLLAEDVRRWHARGARSYLAETSDSWVNGGAGHYLLSRLLWNVDIDADKELDAYYEGAFGPAAGEIRALHEDWARTDGRQGMLQMDRSQMARWHAWIAAADLKLAGDPSLRPRLADVKRYYLYLNLWREYELNLSDPRVPSKQDRYVRLLRYVGANRGEGALHAVGLLPTLAIYSVDTSSALPAIDDWGKEFAALAKNVNDPDAWRSFGRLQDDEVDRLFAAARLPLDGAARSGETFDPILRLAPVGAAPPEAVRFPKLHGPPIPTGPRRYLLHVVDPTPRLALQIIAGAPLGGGTDRRICIVFDSSHAEVARLEFSVGEPVELVLFDVQPGLYTAVFPEFGAEQLTVVGGNTFGAVRAWHDSWGFNAMRRDDQGAQESVVCYFVVPAGRASVKAALADGEIAIGFHGGEAIAAQVRGSVGAPWQEFPIAPSDQPRVAQVRWASGTFVSTGMKIEGVTLYSPDPGGVLYETLD